MNPCLPSVLTVPPTKVKRVLLDGGRHSELQLARLQGTRKGGQRAVERTNRISFWQESRDLSAAYIERATPLEEKNLNYVIPRVNQTGSKGRRGNLVAI